MKIPSSVTEIGINSFSECISIEKITFEEPSSLNTIDEYAFFGCSSLIEITFPFSVIFINEKPFTQCLSLRHSYFEEHSSLNEI